MTVSPPRNDLSYEVSNSAELLIKEARRASRKRRLRRCLILMVLVFLVVGATVYRVEGGTSSSPRIGTGPPKRSPPVMVLPLSAHSRIWTLDMLNVSSGYAVAGASSKIRHEHLIATTNMGKSWHVVGVLPYSFYAGQLKPILHFVTQSIGYTQAFQVGEQWLSNNIYVTTNGGTSWSDLSISGQVPSMINTEAYASTSPDFRISNGVVSLLSLHCSASVDLRTDGACPATLSEYRWGAKQPFSTHGVSNLGTIAGGRQRSAYLITAPSATTALVAEVSYSANATNFALTNDAGKSWTAIANPCRHFPGVEGILISGVSLAPSQSILNCSQGTGMNHATVLLSKTTNNGHSWTALNYTPSWSAKSGAIGGEEDQVWASNGGSVLWSYSSLGYRQVSTDGGRTWKPISVSGRASNENTGGAPIQFDPVGRIGAYFVTESGELLLSRNGTNFTPVRLLHKS